MGIEIAEAATRFEARHGQIGYGTGRGQMVCNQFVLAVLRSTVAPNFPDMTADQFVNSGHFIRVDHPANGDLVHWPGHIGIVTDADHGYFIGSQSSTGVEEANFRTGWWGGQFGGKKPDYFLRYIH